MNNFYNCPNNYDYFANMLPNNPMNSNVNSNNNDILPANEGFLRGNMWKSLYDPYKVNRPFEIQPMNEQAKLLTQLDALCFACIDLNLYLDVYSDDKNMISLFNQYRNQLNELQTQYENKYGPLNLNSEALNAYPWSWDNKPWPWEN